MPIISLQRRLHERGRIRIGRKVPTTNGRSRPEKLDTFRFTSSDRLAIEELARQHGGAVEPWASPNGPQWELISESTDVPVVVPPTEFGFSQHMETWSAGGCARRCDGEVEMISGGSCICAAEDAVICKPTSRLSVILPDLPGMGLWRLEVHGWNAAAELAGTLDLIGGLGRLLPARLKLQQRSAMVDGKTTRFAVPVLDIDVRMPELLASQAQQAGVLVDPTTGEIGPGEPRFTPVPVGELPEGPSPSIADQVGWVADPPPRRPRANAQQPIPATGLAPRTAAQAQFAGEGGPSSAPPAAAATRPAPSPASPEGDPDNYVPAMIARINKIADPKMRKAAMQGFKVAFGDPPKVGPDEVQDAVATIHQFEPQPDPPTGGGAPVPEANGEDPGRPFFEDDADASAPVETPAEQHARLQRGLMAQSAKAFPLEKTEGMLPKEQRERQTAKRHAVAYVTLGRHVSANDMTVDELVKVAASLRDVEVGRLHVAETDGGWAVRSGDREIVVGPEQLAAA